VIGLSPLGATALWCPWTLCLVLQATPIFTGHSVRYHRVLCMTLLRGVLDIQGLAGWRKRIVLV